MSKEQAIIMLEDFINKNKDFTNNIVFLPKHDELVRARMEDDEIIEYTFRGLLKIAYELE